MIMMDRSRRLSEPLRWGRRERTAIAAVLVCVALAILALGVFALTSGSRARADCVNVTFASTLGGAELHACGSRARRVCASGAFRAIQQELRAACDRAGLPFRAPG
ncbi:MAG: hypothetical protein M3Z95_04935 [Actinomycetota bacterium]|nr:hypothetical protein [Actinomycetota bacterium]